MASYQVTAPEPFNLIGLREQNLCYLLLCLICHGKNLARICSSGSVTTTSSLLITFQGSLKFLNWTEVHLKTLLLTLRAYSHDMEFLRYNGPQFQADVYKQFSVDYQFKHVSSSPYFPQSNGEAECVVGTIKNLLKKEGDPYLVFLTYCRYSSWGSISPISAFDE